MQLLIKGYFNRKVCYKFYKIFLDFKNNLRQKNLKQRLKIIFSINFNIKLTLASKYE